MYLDTLAPGAPLWPDLVESVEQRKRLEAAAAAAAEAAAVAAAAEPVAQAGDASVAPPPDEGVGSLEDVGGATQAPPAPEVVPPRQLVVVMGPSGAGCTTQSVLLANRYGLQAASLDDLLFEAADLQEPSLPPPAESEASSSPEASTAHVPPPPVFDAGISDLLYSKMLVDPDLEGTEVSQGGSAMQWVSHVWSRALWCPDLLSSPGRFE
jgi:hypothetical protein